MAAIESATWISFIPAIREGRGAVWMHVNIHNNECFDSTQDLVDTSSPGIQPQQQTKRNCSLSSDSQLFLDYNKSNLQTAQM